MNNFSNRVNRFRQFGLCLVLSIAFASVAEANQSCNEKQITQSTPNVDFVQDTEKGVATHFKTGLMWMRCSLGQTWKDGSCNDFPSNYSWQDALQQADTQVFAGYSDWRLPNKNELASIIEVSCVNPTINISIFPDTPIAYYWTSTPFAAFLDQAWSVHFNNGYITYEFKAGKLHVRLVRGGR